MMENHHFDYLMLLNNSQTNEEGAYTCLTCTSSVLIRLEDEYWMYGPKGISISIIKISIQYTESHIEFLSRPTHESQQPRVTRHNPEQLLMAGITKCRPVMSSLSLQSCRWMSKSTMNTYDQIWSAVDRCHFVLQHNVVATTYTTQ